MAVDGYLNFDTKIDTKGFDSGIKSIGNSVAGLKSMLFKALSLVGLTVGVKELIETAAEINAANSQLTQTFKELEPAAVQAMQRVADKCGIVQTRLQGVGTSIYAFAKTAGMDSAEALTMMEDALQVTADSAAYYDRSLEDVSESLKSFLKGNFENDAALGISCTETTRNAAANAMYGQSFKDLSEAQKQLVLLQMVKDANALSGAMGQASREADGWENVIGNLKETWRQFTAIVGQPFLKGATAAVQILTSALAKLAGWARTAYNTLAEFFGWEKLADKSASVGTAAAESISTAVDQQNALTDAVNGTVKAQENQLAGFDKINKLSASSSSSGSGSGASSGGGVSSGGTGGFTIEADADTSKADRKMSEFQKRMLRISLAVRKYFDKNFLPSWEGIWDGLKAESIELLGTLKGIFSDIKSLGEPLKQYFLGDFTNYLKTAFETCGKIAVGLFDTFNMVFSDIWNIAVFPILRDFITLGLPVITQFWTETTETFGTLFDEVKMIFDMLWRDAAAPTLKLISGIWHDLLTDIKSAWEKWGTPVFTKLRSAISSTGELFREGWNNVIKPVIDKLISKAKEVWDKHLRPVFDKIFDFVGKLIDSALEIYNEFILPVCGWLQDTFGPVVTDVFNGLIDLLGNFCGGIFDVVGDIFDALGGLIDFITGIFTGNWERAWNGLKDFFKGIWDAIKDLFNTLWDGLSGSVDVACDGIKSGFSAAWDGIKSVWNSSKSYFSTNFDIAQKAVKQKFSPVVSFFKEKWSGIKSVFSDVKSWFSDKFSGAAEAVKSSFSHITDWFYGKWTGIKSIFSDVKSWFTEKFNGAVGSIKSAFSPIVGWFSEKWKDITEVFGGAADWFGETFHNAWNRVKSVFNAGGEIFTGITDGILETFKSVVNSLIDGINWVVTKPFEGINLALSKLREVSIFGKKPFDWLGTIDIPQIPHLAKGTVVPANYGEFLAVLGDNKREAEVVSPVSTIEKAVRNAMDGSGGETVLNVILDGKTIYKSIVKRNRETIRMTGSNPLAST